MQGRTCMQPINFIKTVSPQEHRHLLVWYRISVILAFLLFSIICFFQIPQLITLHTVRTAKKNLYTQHCINQPTLDSLQKAQETITRLQKNVDIITQRMTHQQRVLMYLKNSKQLLQGAALESFTYTPKSLTIVFYASSPQAAANTLHLLKQHIPDIPHLSLVSLQPYKQGSQHYTARVTGKIDQKTPILI